MNHTMHSVEVPLSPGHVAEIIRRMTREGCDVSEVLAAADEAKTSERALREAARKAALKAATRRFVVSYVEDNVIKVAQGIEYEDDGPIHVQAGHCLPLSGPDSSMSHLRTVLRRAGLTHFIEYID